MSDTYYTYGDLSLKVEAAISSDMRHTEYLTLIYAGREIVTGYDFDVKATLAPLTDAEHYVDTFCVFLLAASESSEEDRWDGWQWHIHPDSVLASDVLDECTVASCELSILSDLYRGE